MTNIDFSKLSTQYAKDYAVLDFNNIMPLYDYHSWDGGNNPKIDKITNTLLNLKSNRHGAPNFFTKVINTQLSHLPCDGDKIFAIVPSHEKDKQSAGLMSVMANIRDAFKFHNTENHLRRTNTVPKSATGGDRSVQHHIDSIEVIDVINVKNKTVFLFDDISSTGNSMNACKQLLVSAGASNVVMISLGQTWME